MSAHPPAEEWGSPDQIAEAAAAARLMATAPAPAPYGRRFWLELAWLVAERETMTAEQRLYRLAECVACADAQDAVAVAFLIDKAKALVHLPT